MKYITPEIEIIQFNAQDVLTISDAEHSPWQTDVDAFEFY